MDSTDGKLRNKLLNAEVFNTLAEARALIEQWRVHYNEERPHSALGNLTPRVFANQAEQVVLTLETGPAWMRLFRAL